MLAGFWIYFASPPTAVTLGLTRRPFHTLGAQASSPRHPASLSPSSLGPPGRESGQGPGVTYLRSGKEPLPLSESSLQVSRGVGPRLPGLVSGQGPAISSPPSTQPEWVTLICFKVLSPVPREALGKPLPLLGS